MSNIICYIAIALALSSGRPSPSFVHIDDLELKIAESSPSGVITIEMNNSSAKPLRIWDESNSWGAARWRVVVIRNGKTQSFFENPDQDFLRNVPTFEEIVHGKQKTHKLDLNDGNWCGLGYCTSYGQRRLTAEQIRLQSGDTIVVSYDVPFAPESLRLGVWYGVALVSKTIR
jgi:hypothetical protein